jgi:predicted lipid carrier protein YhbT
MPSSSHTLAPRFESLDLAVSLALAALPRPVIAGLLRRLAHSLPARHPKLSERLAELSGRRLLIVPDELPYTFLITFPAGRLAITLPDRTAAPEADATLRGPLRLFYDLVRGGRDGDALFFSRELAVSGDMAAAVTLRNAMDGAGVDLFAEFLDLPRPVGPLLWRAGALLDRCATVVLAPLASRCARLENELASVRAELRSLRDGPARPRPRLSSGLSPRLGNKP